MPEIKVGQVWRRKSDGAYSPVVRIDPDGWIWARGVIFLDGAPRAEFLKTHELVKEAQDGE